MLRYILFAHQLHRRVLNIVDLLICYVLEQIFKNNLFLVAQVI